jgi:integrase
MLLDRIEDSHGPRIADLVLAYIRSITWYAARTEDYVSPVVRGMRRHGQHKRNRILSDDELRLIWAQAEADPGPFGAIVRLALLTAQRREKIAGMRWADLTMDGVWHVPTEHRQKGVGGALPLPPMALEIIKSRPIVAGNEFVFAGRGGSHFSGYSKCKAAFERALTAMPQWQLHDLRRTARSLMSRAGVPSEHAERVLGHTIPGVEGVYDRHRYEAEKGRALAALAELIAGILTGDSKDSRP